MTEDLRVMTSIELFVHYKFYSQHPIFKSLVCDGIFRNVQTALLASISTFSYASYNVDKDLIKTEAIHNCHIGTWSSFLCTLGLSSVIGRSIQTIYPAQGKSNKCFFRLFNSLVNPRTSDSHKDVLNILFLSFLFLKKV